MKLMKITGLVFTMIFCLFIASLVYSSTYRSYDGKWEKNNVLLSIKTEHISGQHSNGFYCYRNIIITVEAVNGCLISAGSSVEYEGKEHFFQSNESQSDTDSFQSNTIKLRPDKLPEVFELAVDLTVIHKDSQETEQMSVLLKMEEVESSDWQSGDLSITEIEE